MDQDINNAKYTAADQMVVAGAHQIRPNDVIYVGLGLPFLSALLAKYTHAPDCTIIIENGIIRATAFELPAATDTLGSQTMSDQLTSLFYISCLGQAGYIHTGFIGAGQVDRHGNVNDTVVGDYLKPVYRWSGSGGANDVMSFCQRTVTMLRQSRRRFPEKVDFITCPGYLDGRPGQREEAGLPPGTGPAMVITDLGCYVFEDGEMVLKSIHAGVGATLERVKAEVGWDIRVSPELEETTPPTEAEIRILREKVDPNQIWVGGRRQHLRPDW
jgi:acyl CoA:acetate/3-ketoacid CoA transferase beta subunit